MLSEKRHDREYTVNLAISLKCAISFYVFIAVAIMVYLMVVMVCGRHGTVPQ